MLQEHLKSLALISIERKFLSVDVKNEVVQIFSERRAHMRKRNCKVCPTLIDLFTSSHVLV